MSDAANCRCSRRREFDPERACQQLARKYTLLSDIVAQYVDQAGLDRPTRNRNARELARRIERIVGGRPTAAGDFPECCLIGERLGNGALSWFCSGTLIHPQVVVTAAHCLNFTAKFHVALNTTDQNQLDDAEVISAKRAITHPDYRGGIHDIGIVILRQASSVAPAPIATTRELIESECTTLVGFGSDDFSGSGGFGLQRRVNVGFRALRRSPDDDLDNEEDLFGFESDLEFVAGGEGLDSCNGDSGGPAYITVRGSRKLVGATSRAAGDPREPCGGGGVYSRVDVHLDWINEVIDGSDLDLDAPRKC